ncbi:MAG: hypothetical protein GXY44_11760, partial [Phycisphaerales bacterium]|nr:hypothetical protein [Phycisphaerales bacterium]
MLMVAAGCGRHPLETGFANQGKTQIQFFTPSGATVAVRACPTRSHQIPVYGAFENRLEQSPEQFCVFNLAPGRYEFKYTGAEGLPGASIYGELIVEHANSHKARVYQRRSFIPVALPSEQYKRVAPQGDEIFPYRGEAYRYAIDELDFERLRQGDVIEKVVFVADLAKAERVKNRTETALAVCENELEYANKRYQIAYRNYLMDVHDPLANFFGSDKEHLKWERRRQEKMQRIEMLQHRLRRVQALLKGDHVLIREGMLVLATEEVVKPHTNVVD